MSKKEWHIATDIVIVLITIVFAIYISEIGAVDYMLGFFGSHYILASFVAGIFFTSVFTTAPAIAFLAILGGAHDPITVALVGGLGALIGDLIIFKFFKKNVSADIDYAITKTKSKRLAHLLRNKAFKWFITSVGALVIASPLPDELGLALMGLSKVPLHIFVPISFSMNALGIFVIALIARSV